MDHLCHVQAISPSRCEQQTIINSYTQLVQVLHQQNNEFQINLSSLTRDQFSSQIYLCSAFYTRHFLKANSQNPRLKTQICLLSKPRATTAKKKKLPLNYKEQTLRETSLKRNLLLLGGLKDVVDVVCLSCESQLRFYLLFCQPSWLWEKTGPPKVNPHRHGESLQTAHRKDPRLCYNS